MRKAGVLKGSHSLQPSSTATTVRIAGGKPQVLDGPYADTKEQFGGYFIIEVDDLDFEAAALELEALDRLLGLVGERAQILARRPDLRIGVALELGDLARPLEHALMERGEPVDLIVELA